MPKCPCVICGKNSYVKPSHLSRGWGKYCSISCRNKAQYTGKHVSCHICAKKIYRAPRILARSKSHKYFCSKSCQTKWRNSVFIEDRSANWKLGKSSYRNILLRRSTHAMCFRCGISDIRVLQAHHKNHDRSNNTKDNLIWLCLNCHYLTHHDDQLDAIIRTVRNP